MILTLLTIPAPDQFFSVVLFLCTYCFYSWLFLPAAPVTKLNKTLQTEPPQVEERISVTPCLMATIRLSPPATTNTTKVAIAVKNDFVSEPLGDAWEEDIQTDTSPVIAAPSLIQAPLQTVISEDDREAIKTIENLTYRKSGIDPSSKTAEGDLARWLFELNSSVTHPRSLSQWNTIYQEYSHRVATAINKAAHPVLSTAERRSRNFEAIKNRLDKKEQFTHKPRGLALQEF